MAADVAAATDADCSSAVAAADSASPPSRRLIELEQEARSTLAQLQRLMQLQREQEQQMAVSSRRSTGDEMQLGAHSGQSAVHARVRITDLQLDSCSGGAMVDALRGDVATLQQQLQAERQLMQQAMEQMRTEWNANASAAFAAAASTFQAAIASPGSKGNDVAVLSTSSSSLASPSSECVHCHRCRECGATRRIRGWRIRIDLFTCCLFMVPLLLVGAGIGAVIYRNRDNISMLLRLRRIKDNAGARMKMPFLSALPPGAAKPVQAVQAKFSALRADALALATSNGTAGGMSCNAISKPSLPASMSLLNNALAVRTVEQAVQQVGLVIPCLLQLTGATPATSAAVAPVVTAPGAPIAVLDAPVVVSSAPSPPAATGAQ